MPAWYLLEHAERIKQDLLELHWQQVESGVRNADETPDLPVLTYAWLKRWWRAYGVSWRTVTLRLKCSKTKLLGRLRDFWRNVFRLRGLAYFLLGSSDLPWINCDQKPLWFCSSANEKTLSRLGTRDVLVKENMPATRERFTVMTRTAWPALPDDGKTFAIMFRRSEEGDGSRIRAGLKIPDECLLQFGPKGSYRTDTTAEFYRWVLPAERAACPFIVLAEWFKPNMDPEVRDAIEKASGMLLMIPG